MRKVDWSARYQELAAFDAASGRQPLAGVDEAGRGPLAGPVAVAAVVMPSPPPEPFRIDDSKAMTARQREAAYATITEAALAWAVEIVTVEEIDRLNILNATLRGMRRACQRLRMAPATILIDGNRQPPGLEAARLVVNGDGRSLATACASVIAKVTRDRIMVAADVRYPEYGFARHKGYGTAAHLEALHRCGPCALHRRTFRPVRASLWEREVSVLIKDMHGCASLVELEEIREIGQRLLDVARAESLRPGGEIRKLNQLYRQRKAIIEARS